MLVCTLKEKEARDNLLIYNVFFSFQLPHFIYYFISLLHGLL